MENVKRIVSKLFQFVEAECRTDGSKCQSCHEGKKHSRIYKVRQIYQKVFSGRQDVALPQIFKRFPKLRLF